MGRQAESAIPSLLDALKDGDACVRARAAMAIPFILTATDDPGADNVRIALTAALADRDPGARHAAAVALGMRQPYAKAVVPALIEATGDADPMIRAWAVSTLRHALDDERVWSTILAATGIATSAFATRRSEFSATRLSRRGSPRFARHSRRL
jgi:HEAT repeat protein